MDLKYFTKQNVSWLKSYLKERGISIDGRNKPELVSLAYKAEQMGLQIAVLPDDGEANSARRRKNLFKFSDKFGM